MDKDRVLRWAARHGRKKLIKLTLEKGANIESRDSKWSPSALGYAASNGDEATVILLLASGANIDAASCDGTKPIAMAAADGHEAVVRLLMERGSDIYDYLDERFPMCLALEHAVENGHEAVITHLFGSEIARDAISDRHILSSAAKCGHERVVKFLLERSGDIYLSDIHKSNDEYAALINAAKNGHGNIVTLLLNSGIDIKDRAMGVALNGAAKNGHEAVVNILLREGAGVNHRDRCRRSPLINAASSGHESIVVLLLDSGAEVAAVDYEGMSALANAANGGYGAVVAHLLKIGAGFMGLDIQRRTILHHAAIGGHAEATRLLLERGINLNAKDIYGRTALHHAAIMDHENIIRVLLEKEPDIKAMDSDGRTALHNAAINGNEKAIAALLETGLDIDTRDKVGKTALHHAIIRGNERIVMFLLRQGADITAYANTTYTLCDVRHSFPEHIVEYYTSSLHLAVTARDEAIVKILLDHEANDTAYNRERDEAALHAAVTREHRKITERSLDRVVDINAVDSQGKTALHIASMEANDEVIKLLLSRGANATVYTHEASFNQFCSTTALHLLVVKGYETLINRNIHREHDDRPADFYKPAPDPDTTMTALATLLVRSGANVDAMDGLGKTPLQHAARMGFETVIKLLLDLGANIDAVDNEGSSASDIALTERNLWDPETLLYGYGV